MKDKPADPRHLNVSVFARGGEFLQGQLALESLSRLGASLVLGEAAVVDWQARGSWRQPEGREPVIRLHVKARVGVRLVCQRCLEPMPLDLQAERDIRFVADEKLAEEMDESSEDEDVLALPRRLDLIELVEDELILALPLVPRHSVCPSGVEALMSSSEPAPDPARGEDGPHPFAALAALRKRPPES